MGWVVVIGILALVAGLALVVWGAERFTDGAIRLAARLALSTFFVGAVVSGLEPENLASGAAAALGGLPQIALGTVIGSTIFLLTGALGLALLIAPMDVRIPREGPLAMVLSLALFAVALWTDGTVSRLEGVLLAVAAVGLMLWLYRRSPVFRTEAKEAQATSGLKVMGLLVAGAAVMVLGAELLVHGARTLLNVAALSETFLGMAVVGMGESLEETARMTAPAQRGHPELAWGNVVGTTRARNDPTAERRPARAPTPRPLLSCLYVTRCRSTSHPATARAAGRRVSCRALRRLSRIEPAIHVAAGLTTRQLGSQETISPRSNEFQEEQAAEIYHSVNRLS
jgi:cation:H+ antiporter